MITTRGLVHLSGYDSSVCSNYLAGRKKFVPKSKRWLLDKIASFSHTQLIDMHLRTGGTLTMAQALTWYGIGALSQRVGELNRQYEKQQYPYRVVNTSGRGPGVYAVYKLEKSEK